VEDCKVWLLRQIVAVCQVVMHICVLGLDFGKYLNCVKELVGIIKSIRQANDRGVVIWFNRKTSFETSNTSLGFPEICQQLAQSIIGHEVVWLKFNTSFKLGNSLLEITLFHVEHSEDHQSFKVLRVQYQHFVEQIPGSLLVVSAQRIQLVKFRK